MQQGRQEPRQGLTNLGFSTDFPKGDLHVIGRGGRSVVAKRLGHQIKAYRLTGTTLSLTKKFFGTWKFGEKRNPATLNYTKSSCASTVHG